MLCAVGVSVCVCVGVYMCVCVGVLRVCEHVVLHAWTCLCTCV